MAKGYGYAQIGDEGPSFSDYANQFSNALVGLMEQQNADKRDKDATAVLSSALAEARGAGAATEKGAPELVGGAKGKGYRDPFENPLAMLNWADRAGLLDLATRSGVLPQLISLSTGRAPADRPLVPMDDAAKAMAAKRYGVPQDTFKGAWQWDSESGHVKQVAAEPEVKAAALPRYHHIGAGVMVNESNPADRISVDEYLAREAELRKAGADSQTINIGEPSKIPEQARAAFVATRATLAAARDSVDTLERYSPSFMERAAGAAGIMGPEGGAAETARNGLLFNIAKLAEQGALQAPDRAVAEGMIGAIFDPRIGPETRAAKMTEFKRWLDALEAANDARVSTAPPTIAPGATLAEPAAPTARKAAPARGPSIADRFRSAK